MTTATINSVKKVFTIIIEETLSQSFEIEAASFEEAMQLCAQGYKDSEYIVDGEACVEEAKVGYYDSNVGEMKFEEI